MPTPLDPEELGSLMQAVSDAGKASEPVGPAAVPHDLTNPERNLPEPMPALEAAHERLASRFARAIAGRTRQRFVLQPGRITKCRHEEIGDLMMPPTVIAVLDLIGTGRQALLLIERNLAEAFLAAGLGLSSDGEALTDGGGDDAFTALERTVLRRILSLLEGPLAQSYTDITRLRPKMRRIEPDPRLARILEDGEVAIAAKFRAEGELNGTLHLVMPFAVLESAKRELVQLPHRDVPVRNPNTGDRIRRTLSDVRVAVEVDFGAKRMPMASVSRLCAGDLITLNTDENTALAVRVNGMTKMLAHPTVSDGALAATVTEMAPKGHGLQRGSAPQAALRLLEGGAGGVGKRLEQHTGMEGSMNDADAPGDPANPGPIDPMGASTDMPQVPHTPLNLDDVQVNVTVRLGRTSMSIGEVMQVAEGSVIKLDKAAGEPLDVLVNGRLIGRGEAVVVGERFGVRLTHVTDDAMKGAA